MSAVPPWVVHIILLVAVVCIVKGLLFYFFLPPVQIKKLTRLFLHFSFFSRERERERGKTNPIFGMRIQPAVIFWLPHECVADQQPSHGKILLEKKTERQGI